MKWEIYKKLTEGEKEEYNYKFGGRINFFFTKHIGMIFGSMYVIMWLIFIGMNTTLLLLGNTSSINIVEYLSSSMIVLYNVSEAFLIFIVMILIIDLFKNLIISIEKKDWINERFETTKIEVKRK